MPRREEESMIDALFEAEGPKDDDDEEIASETESERKFIVDDDEEPRAGGKRSRRQKKPKEPKEPSAKRSRAEDEDDFRADTDRIKAEYRDEAKQADGVDKSERTKTRSKYRGAKTETMASPPIPSAPKHVCRAGKDEPDYDWAIQIADVDSFRSTMLVSLGNLETANLEFVVPTEENPTLKPGIKLYATDEGGEIFSKTTFNCNIIPWKTQDGDDVDANAISIRINAKGFMHALSNVSSGENRHGTLLISHPWVQDMGGKDQLWF